MTRKALLIIYDKRQIRSLIEPETFNYFQLDTDLEIFILCPESLKSYVSGFAYKFLMMPTQPILLRRSGSLLASSLLWRRRFRSIAHLRRATYTFGRKKVRRLETYHANINEKDIKEIYRIIIRIIALSPVYKLCNLIRLRSVLSLIFLIFVFKSSDNLPSSFKAGTKM